MFQQKNRERVNLAHMHANTGSVQIRAFKDIVQEAVYPKYPERFSSGSMVLAERTFKACQKSNCSQEELIDLMLFYVECGSQFTIDYGDMDEHFYTALETAFEEALTLIKAAGSGTLATYKHRLHAIAAETADMGWGYGDQIRDLIEFEFPDFFRDN